jgi:hypothetical protein
MTDVMHEDHCGLSADELVPLAKKLLEVPQHAAPLKNSPTFFLMLSAT